MPDSAEIEEAVEEARALIARGDAAFAAGGHDEAFADYDAVVERFGEESSDNVRRTLAWALHNKATALGKLARYDEMFATVDALASRFGDATDDEIRPRVSWGLWKKAHRLGEVERHAEARPIYDELIARRDETLDPALGAIVAWCLWQVANELGGAGDVDGQSAVLDDIVERFGHSTDVTLRRDALNAIWRKASEQSVLGRREEELALYDDILSRFGADQAPEIHVLVADTIRATGSTLYRMGRQDDAFAAYDDALAFIGEASEPLLRAEVAKVLLTKGGFLARAGRHAEAVVVLDGVVSAYIQVADDPALGSPTLARAFLALLDKLLALDALDRPEGAARVGVQLADALGDTAPTDADAAQAEAPATEADLAALVAQVHGGDCWFLQATGGRDLRSQRLMADRAMELYGATSPILDAGSENWSERASAAAFLLRNVADGYALLSRPWLAKDLAELPLPRQADAELGIRLLGIDDWAAELGHPIALRDSADVAEESLRQRHEASDADEDAADRVPRFLISVHQYELFSTLCASGRSTGVLPNAEVRSFAAWRISEARKWVGWMGERDPEGATVAAAMLLMAQGCFAAACTPSPCTVFPSPLVLREMLRESTTQSWLARHEIELPEWLQDDDGD